MKVDACLLTLNAVDFFLDLWLLVSKLSARKHFSNFIY